MKRIKTGSVIKVINNTLADVHDWAFWDTMVPSKVKDKGFIYNKSAYPSEFKTYIVEYVDNDLRKYLIRELDTLFCYIISRDGIVHIDDYKEEDKEKNTEEPTTGLVDINKNLKEIKEALSKKTDFENAMIEGIIEKGKELSVEDIKKKLLKDCDTYIEEHYGVLPKKIIYKDEQIEKECTGLYHYKFEDILRIVKKDIPLMLTGPAGAGKNHTIEQVAQTLGLDFYFTNSITQEYKLTGFIDANGKYHETEFYKAFTKGGIFFLDEIDASVPEALIILNSAIANRYFDFPTGRVVANENFRVVCAGNTYGTGADMIYVGRNVLDGATLDRFVCIDFDYDEDIEKSLSYDIEQYEFIKELRRVVNENSLRYIVSMRAIINSTKMLEIGFDKLTILKEAIIKNMQIDDLNTIIKKFNETNNDWYRELRKLCD